MTAPVMRPDRVRVTYQGVQLLEKASIFQILIIFMFIADRFGDYHENEVGGFYSRVLQHEIDHLHGRLFVNKIVHSTTDPDDIGHLLLS